MSSWLGKRVNDPRFDIHTQPRDFETLCKSGAKINDVYIFAGGVAVVQVNGKRELFFVKEILGLSLKGVWLYSLDNAVKCLMKWYRGRVDENSISRFVLKTFVNGAAADEEWVVFSDHEGTVMCDEVNEMDTLTHLAEYERCRNTQLIVFDSFLSFTDKKVCRVDVTTRCNTFCIFTIAISFFRFSIETLAHFYRALSPGQNSLRNMCSRAAEKLQQYMFAKRAEGTTYLLPFNFDCETFIQVIHNVGLAHSTTYIQNMEGTFQVFMFY